jgi:hypothetical protein
MYSRHPLQEQVVAAFVPNDTYIAGGNGTGSNTDEDSAEEVSSIAVLTGANACGKVLSLYFYFQMFLFILRRAYISSKWP